jgi:hypothetical protein
MTDDRDASPIENQPDGTEEDTIDRADEEDDEEFDDEGELQDDEDDEEEEGIE